MTYVHTKVSGTTETNQGVHIGSVHINLPTVGVYGVAHCLDFPFKYAVRGGIRHHEGG